MARRKIHSIPAGRGRVINVYRDSEWDEFVVQTVISGKVVGGKDGGGYHTSDKDDALSTAEHLAVSYGAGKRKPRGLRGLPGGKTIWWLLGGAAAAAGVYAIMRPKTAEVATGGGQDAIQPVPVPVPEPEPEGPIPLPGEVAEQPPAPDTPDPLPYSPPVGKDDVYRPPITEVSVARKLPLRGLTRIRVR